MSEPAEGARLLSEYTGLNLYREFKSLPLRHIANKTAKLSDDNLAVFAFKKGVFLASTWGSTPKTGASDPPPEKYAIEKFVFLT